MLSGREREIIDARSGASAPPGTVGAVAELVGVSRQLRYILDRVSNGGLHVVVFGDEWLIAETTQQQVDLAWETLLPHVRKELARRSTSTKSVADIVGHYATGLGGGWRALFQRRLDEQRAWGTPDSDRVRRVPTQVREKGRKARRRLPERCVLAFFCHPHRRHAPVPQRHPSPSDVSSSSRKALSQRQTSGRVATHYGRSGPHNHVKSTA